MTAVTKGTWRFTGGTLPRVMAGVAPICGVYRGSLPAAEVRTYGLPDPAPLTYREEAALARIQAETGLRALDMGNYSAALAYFRDAADFMEKAVRKIGEITK